MSDFSQRFEIIYQKFAEFGIQNGFKPSKLAFSRYLGVTQGAMQKWERGTIPSAKVVKTIHDKLGFSFNWRISGEGEMMDTAAERLAALEDEVSSLKRQVAEASQARDGMGKAVGQE